MSKFDEIKAVIAATEADADKFYNKSNKAAGTRVRSAMLQIKNLAHDGRKEISDTKE